MDTGTTIRTAILSPGNAPATADNKDGSPLPETGKSLPEPGPHAVDQAVRLIQHYLAESSRQLQFERDETSGRTIIRVVNPDTGEVIREIPPAEVVRLSAGAARGNALLDLLV